MFIGDKKAEWPSCSGTQVKWNGYSQTETNQAKWTLLVGGEVIVGAETKQLYGWSSQIDTRQVSRWCLCYVCMLVLRNCTGLFVAWWSINLILEFNFCILGVFFRKRAPILTKAIYPLSRTGILSWICSSSVVLNVYMKILSVLFCEQNLFHCPTTPRHSCSHNLEISMDGWKVKPYFLTLLIQV